MSSNDENDWVVVRIPNSIRVGIGGCGDQILHTLNMGDRWSVYISEKKFSDMHDFSTVGIHTHKQDIAGWGIEFDKREFISGYARTVETAKNIAMTVLCALMEGPEPDVGNDQDFDGPIQGGPFGMPQ